MKDAKLITAMVTPFTENDLIDYDVLEKLMTHIFKAGGDGFLIGGTTGEGPTLSETEKLTLFTRAAQINAGRALLIANTGSNSTRATIALTKAAGKIAGVDACLVVVPYYNKPDQAGMLAHFTAVADASSVPIIIYNIPGRTGVNMNVATAVKLAQHPNIVGIKQCGSLQDYSTLVARTPADFHVWTGEDAQFVSALTLGGSGVISVASHLYAEQMVQTFNALTRGDLKTVAALQRTLLPKMAALFAWPSPAPVKAALNASGFAVGSPRLPLLALTDQQQGQLAQKLGVPALAQLNKEEITA